MAPLEASPAAEPKVFTASEVEKHNTIHDCWLSVDGVVYDVTDFIESHPGGSDIVLQHAGKDVSLVMRDPTSNDHSDSAFDMLREYQIGYLSDYDGIPKGLRRRPGGGRGAVPEEDIPDTANNADLFDNDGEMDSLVDFTKPIVTQIWNQRIPLKKYLKFTHTPRYIRGNKPARLFTNDFLEFCSRTPWYVIAILWTPVWMTMLYLGSEGELTPWKLANFAFGIFNWSLMEYTLHRFVFHVDNMLPDTHLAICAHFLIHGVHHLLPMDPLRLVFPPALGFFMFFALFSPYYLLFPWHQALLIFGGGVFGYECYDLTHYYLHHGVPLTQYLRDLKSYHLNHHYKDYHLGYGITSKFWDFCFGTLLN